MRLRFYSCLFLLSFISCRNEEVRVKHDALLKKKQVVIDTKDSGNAAQLQETFLKKMIPVQGYRFVVKGDFDGDGKPEILTEHYFSRKEGKETAKYYEGVEFDRQVELTCAKEPYSFLTCSNPAIPNLQIADQPQLFGISYLKNEGDLNGDGRDEISYVIDWADWSSINTCYVMTFKNNKWQEILSFAIRDWQLPDLPQSTNSYGLFGLADKEAVPEDEKLQNQQSQRELDAFPGFIKKVSKNKIKVAHINDDADEATTIINLKKVKRIPGF